MTEHRHLVTLSRAECLRLLADPGVGRVILTANALPTAMPVNFVLDGRDIVFRSGDGLKLSAAETGTVVAFEVDHFDPSLRMGWSVLVTGIARRVVGDVGVAAAEALDIPTWAEPSPAGYVRIETGVVSGRRLIPVPQVVQNGHATPQA